MEQVYQQQQEQDSQPIEIFLLNSGKHELKKVFQRLLRTPKPDRKRDLLSDREYHELAATSFEDYQRNNFNSAQLQQLSAAETAQLETYYQLLERKSERTQKRIRDKRQKKIVPPVVIRYVPAPTTLEQGGLTLSLTPDPDPEIAREDDNYPRQVLDDIEKRLSDPPTQQQLPHPRRLTDEIERAVDELNESLDMIDLSKALPPKELLLEESVVREPLVHESIEELDLGPPGDAGAFLGVDRPMPLTDSEVLSQLLLEFPSLRRPAVGGRFEELDEMASTEIELMPPPPWTGISYSTPIAGVPTSAIQRAPGRFERLYNTDLSAIKGPTPTDIVAVRTEDGSAIQVEHIDAEKACTEKDVPVQKENGSSEPVEQISEPIQITASEPTELAQPEIRDVVVLAPVSATTESSSSVEQPVKQPRNVRKSHKKVPTYGESSVVVRMKQRTNFEFDCGWRDLGKSDPIRLLIQWIIEFPRDSALPLARQSFPVDIEGHPVLRDISTTQAEISSIREQNQSRLFPIQERPQQEELAGQQLQHVSLPVPYEEVVEHPISVPVVPPCPTLPEISLGDSTLDTGLGNQQMFLDASTNLTNPSVVITDNDGRFHREPPSNDKPEVEQPVAGTKDALAQPAMISGRDEPRGQHPVEKVAEAAENMSANNEVLCSIITLFLTIQREIVCSKRNLVSFGRLAQITSNDRVVSARRFLHLLSLKQWGFIEIKVDSESYVQIVSLR